jgi:transposase
VRAYAGCAGRQAETRAFWTMTRSLQVMRGWLVECGVTVAAMESTSTYWKGAFYCLEEVMEVWLVNAAHIQAISRRKTDVKDAEWIASCWSADCCGRRSCRRRTFAGCGC